MVPLQDGLDEAVADALVAMELLAPAQRWATGVEVETDEATREPRATFLPGADRARTVHRQSDGPLKADPWIVMPDLIGHPGGPRWRAGAASPGEGTGGPPLPRG